MKALKRILVAALAVALLSGTASYLVVAANSEPAVVYDGRAKEIVFENVWPFGENEAPDLFVNCKDLMPGDSVVQEITVGAKNLGEDTVRIHLRAENPNADFVKLTRTYGHWVTFAVKADGKEITGDLYEGIILGTFDEKDTITVSVELSIDVEAGNALQNLVAEVDWIFTAEVLPGTVTPPAPDVEEDDVVVLTKKHVNYIIGYEDNTVRPGASITRAELATIFFRLLTDEAREELWCTESIYPDVTEDSWYYVAVCTLTNGGYLQGYPDGTFQPNAPITRAELATIICRFDAKFGEMETTETFLDVDGHWAEEYVEFAATRKYVIGYPDETFRPNQGITRAETVTMVNRCLHRAVDKTGLTGDYLTWEDNLPGDWYYYEILEAANNHAYVRSARGIDNQSYCYEDWTELRPLIEWAKVEQEWTMLYTGH